MVRNLTPAVPFRVSQRGQNPREAPLVCLRDVRDTQLLPVPLGRYWGQRGWAMECNGTKYMPLQAMPTVLRTV